MSLTRTIYEIFFQDSIAWAKAYLDKKGNAKYTTIEEIPTLQVVEKHLDKEFVAGAYTVSPGNTVRWLAWDIDSKVGIEKAREIAKKISEFLTINHIPHAIEFSGSKGYHIYVFFTDKVEAAKAKLVGDGVRDFFGFARSGPLHVEVYPKQDSVSDGEFGNLLRLPLGHHPKTKKEAFFVDTLSWEEGDALDPEEIFSKKINLNELEEALAQTDPLDQIANVLSPYWSAGQRHDITLCTSGMCASSGWTKERTEDLISVIHDLVPEGELEDQLKAVDTTFRRYANGEKILGENGLAGFVPARVLMHVRTLMGASTSSLVLQTLDAIRLEKNPAFIKVRNAARAAVAYFKEHGRLVRDDHSVYWLNFEDRKLTLIDSYAWTRLAHNLLGINISESFGRQVAESIRHYAYEAAKEVIVRKRSYWDAKAKLWYLNVGGPEIYVADGNEIRVVYNGEIDILFRNADDTMCLPNLLEEDDMLDPWEMLIEDVNFKDGSATIHQQKQLLKAYVCAMFFPEAMPTRPLLMILGDPGAGKTTTARRILWSIEGTNEDVLGQVPDKPDALRASMAAHRMIVIDNIEKTKVVWLPDVLNRAATGSQIELRELHTTNRVQKIIFNIFICMTGTEIPFSEETVYTRILPIELKQLDTYQSEGAMRSNIANNFKAFWKGLLFELNKVVAELALNTSTEFPSQTRLADFSVFCNRIKGVDFLEGKELMDGLGNLVDRQKETLKENSPFIAILDALIKTRPEEMVVMQTASELFAKAQRYASLHKQRFDWGNAQGLSKHINMLEDQLKKHYGLVVKKDIEAGREIKKYKFTAAAAHVPTKTTESEKAH